MAKDNKVRMPTSGGGLVNYYGDTKSKYQFKPGHVIVLIVVIILIELILHWQGSVWFGP